MDKIKNMNGTVHYTSNGSSPACGPIGTHSSWLEATVTEVTCKRCIARFGADTNIGIDAPVVINEHVARRAAERAARQAARQVPGVEF